MPTVNLNLTAFPHGFAQRDAQAVYDLDSGKLTGPDADYVGRIVSAAQDSGYARPVPGLSISLPPSGAPLDPAQLAAVLVPFWDLSATDLPPHPVPQDWDAESDVELLN